MPKAKADPSSQPQAIEPAQADPRAAAQASLADALTRNPGLEGALQGVIDYLKDPEEE